MTGRPRTIQPSAFLDGALWDAEQGTSLPLFRGFAGLWCQADREGRFEWKPRELKLAILPYWDGDFELVLSALAEREFVVRYEVSGRQYGLVRNFKKHQLINGKESPSRLPPVPRGTRDSREDDATPTRPGQEMTRFSLFPELDPGSYSRSQISSGDSDPDLTGSAREDDELETQVIAKTPFESDAERDSFGHWEAIVWRKVHAKGSARATPQRLKPIRARLREGRTPDEFKRACEAVAQSPFHFGDNDTGGVHIEPKTLFRNAETMEKWLATKAPKPKLAHLTPADRDLAERDEKLMDEIRRGVWGVKAREVAAQRPIDMRLFRQAIKEGKVKRIEEPRSAPLESDVRALAAGVGRSMP